MSPGGKGCALGCGAALLGLGAVIAFLSLGLSLTHAIFPGSSGTVRSASLEGYDIHFRTNLGMVGGIMAHPAEWHLRVPRAFIRTEIGDNGALRDAHRTNGESYYIGIQAIMDHDSGQLRRLPLFGQPDLDKEFILDLANSTAARLKDPKVGKDICITGDDYFHDENCGHGIVFCNIESSFKGWKVTIFVRPAVYRSGKAVLEEACDRMRKTLADYTISVDDISEERH